MPRGEEMLGNLCFSLRFPEVSRTVSIKMGDPQARWMVYRFMSWKIPWFEMDDKNRGSPMTSETSISINNYKYTVTISHPLLVTVTHFHGDLKVPE